MDKRFGEKTRKSFEQATGLGPEDYWDESYPGGSAIPADETGVTYAFEHGASVFGWQAHGDHCGGQKGVPDSEIQERLDTQIAKLKQKYPGRHFRIFATEEGIDIQEVK
ncbi:hypothetical protein HYV22_00995 [Candidatus Gottesmanbacteria bacterium]|nr:hypothetical protein [Candidatus Gottesmanbacteria bacterium]